MIISKQKPQKSLNLTNKQQMKYSRKRKRWWTVGKTEGMVFLPTLTFLCLCKTVSHLDLKLMRKLMCLYEQSRYYLYTILIFIIVISIFFPISPPLMIMKQSQLKHMEWPC